jgi:hypothetical protein
VDESAGDQPASQMDEAVRYPPYRLDDHRWLDDLDDYPWLDDLDGCPIGSVDQIDG